MVKVAGFENLECWKKSVELAARIYQITQRGGFEKDYGLKDQIRRASVSISSNIAEGKERQSIAEFIRFLYIAKGSSGELRTQLLIANRIGYLGQEEFDNLNQQTLETSKMIAGLIKSLRKNSL